MPGTLGPLVALPAQGRPGSGVGGAYPPSPPPLRASLKVLGPPEANFPRAGPATGAKRQPVAAAFAQPGLPEKLANFGRAPPARREDFGPAEGSARRPLIFFFFVASPGPSASVLGAGRRKRACGPTQAPGRTWYSIAPEFNAFLNFF